MCSREAGCSFCLKQVYRAHGVILSLEKAPGSRGKILIN